MGETMNLREDCQQVPTKVLKYVRGGFPMNLDENGYHNNPFALFMPFFVASWNFYSSFE